MRSKRRQYQKMLSVLASHFIERGWVPEIGSKDLSRLYCEPSPRVQHWLSMYEPTVAEVPAPNGHAYVVCRVFFSFPEVQNFIDSCLGYEQLHAGVSLHELVPGRKMYDFHSVELEPNHDAPSLDQFLNDYDRFMTPVQLKMVDESIFLDPDFSLSRSSWDIRRLAYLRLRGSANQWQELAEKMEAEALDILNTVAAPDTAHPGIFTNVDQLVRSGQLSSAQEVLRLITAFKRISH